MSMSFDSSYRESKLQCDDLFACLMDWGNFLMNLSLGLGGWFENYRDACVNFPSIPRGIGA